MFCFYGRKSYTCLICKKKLYHEGILWKTSTKPEFDAISELIYIKNWIVQSRKLAATLPEQEKQTDQYFGIKAGRSV